MSERTDPEERVPHVMVARGVPRVAPQATLVLGFDRDEASRAALVVAVDLGERLQAHLAVVHIVSLGDYPLDPDDPGWETAARANLAAEHAQVEQALDGYRFGWSYEARSGQPVEVLVRVAEERDAYAIVVGRHGHGVSENLRRLIDGSVSHRLMKLCPRPILVVPSDPGRTAG